MPVFKINLEISLGFSHSGGVCASGNGNVELTDGEVQQLVDLVRENGGETDVEELGLEERYPEIYEKLDEACSDAAYSAEYNHWVIEGYENGYYEVDDEDAIAKCEDNYGFVFVFDREKYLEENPGCESDEDDVFNAKVEAFFDWVDEYRGTLDEDEEASFLADVFEIDVDIDGVDYEVVIPEDIVKMAEVGFTKDN